jgi:ribosomal protein S18 acetylase RimI-like enzyme
MIPALIEELSLNAWPALQTLHYDGWALRFANRYTRRSNSVNILQSSTLPLDEKIAHCESVYAERVQDVVFKLTSFTEPPHLDALLEERGYSREAESGVQTLRLNDVGEKYPDNVSIIDKPTEEWIELFCRLNGTVGEHKPTMISLLRNIVPRTAFAALKRDGEFVAVGLGVLERGHLGLFDIATAPYLRNRGLGTELVRSLLHWGQSEGAETAYLQVMKNNAPALRLYEKLGFSELYPYWYRVKRGARGKA